MADGTLDSDLLLLTDNWPGHPTGQYSPPTDGFTGASSHNVEAAAYPLGTKISVYNRGTAGQAGLSTLIYLQLLTQHSTNLVAAKSVVVQDSATVWWKVTNATANVASTQQAAIALSAMTTAYYGWFWCGGVCPEDFVSGLGGNYLTNGLVVAASQICPTAGLATAVGSTGVYALGPAVPVLSGGGGTHGGTLTFTTIVGASAAAITSINNNYAKVAYAFSLLGVPFGRTLAADS
jgi:hypothetical protein